MSRRSSAIEWRTHSRLIRRSSAGSNPRASCARIDRPCAHDASNSTAPVRKSYVAPGCGASSSVPGAGFRSSVRIQTLDVGNTAWTGSGSRPVVVEAVRNARGDEHDGPVDDGS